MVTDFGVAKAVDAASTKGGEGIKPFGLALGTVAHEMLPGQSAFAFRPAQTILAAQVTENPVDLLSCSQSSPPGPLVTSAIAKDPSDRQ